MLPHLGVGACVSYPWVAVIIPDGNNPKKEVTCVSPFQRPSILRSGKGMMEPLKSWQRGHIAEAVHNTRKQRVRPGVARDNIPTRTSDSAFPRFHSCFK